MVMEWVLNRANRISLSRLSKVLGLRMGHQVVAFFLLFLYTHFSR